MLKNLIVEGDPNIVSVQNAGGWGEGQSIVPPHKISST